MWLIPMSDSYIENCFNQRHTTPDTAPENASWRLRGKGIRLQELTEVFIRECEYCDKTFETRVANKK